MKHSLTLFLMAWMLAAISCKQNTIYHSYRPVEPAGWEKNDTLFYTLQQPIANSGDHCLSIGIRHKDSYEYQDIWLVVNTDTVHLQLADPSGYWHGKGIGELRQYTHHPIPVPNHRGDTIREIRITHIMQDNPLKGIHDIGIEISRN